MPKHGKKPSTYVEIKCEHCGGANVAFDTDVTISAAVNGEQTTRKADRYTCLDCRKTFVRPRGEAVRYAPLEMQGLGIDLIPVQPVGRLVDINPPTTVYIRDEEPAPSLEPEESKTEAE